MNERASRPLGLDLLRADPFRVSVIALWGVCARVAGQTAGGIIVSLLFAVASADAAPRLGLAIGAVLTLAAGLASTLQTPLALDARVV
jgi:DHA2 family multidrug resistance protein-like MFS transporter